MAERKSVKAPLFTPEIDKSKVVYMTEGQSRVVPMEVDQSRVVPMECTSPYTIEHHLDRISAAEKLPNRVLLAVPDEVVPYLEDSLDYITLRDLRNVGLISTR